jgi:hypothetical protein
VLADPLHRVLAVTRKKPAELLVRREAAEEIVRHRGDGVIAAEALVERLRLRRLVRENGKREQDHTGECQGFLHEMTSLF